MMEASVAPNDAGHTLMGPLDSPVVSSATFIPPSPLQSPPAIPSSLPPARPSRPKPPPPAKSSQLPSAPPPPPCSPPSLPPPLPPVSISPLPQSSNPPAAFLPPDLSSPLLSPSPVLTVLPTVSSDLISSNPPLSPSLSPKLSSPPDLTSSSPSPQLLTPIDQLVATASIWQPKGLNRDQISSITEKMRPGEFLVHGEEDNMMTLSVRISDGGGAPPTRNLSIKRCNTYVHLDGSSVVFDDIVKLISFYCASRDILDIPLRLPHAVTMATNGEELQIISSMGSDFWTSDLHQQAKNQILQQDHNRMFLYINPVRLEESPSKDLNQACKLNTSTKANTAAAFLQNGESPQKASPEVKEPNKNTTNQEVKFKRPPPRPPSLGSGPGMGLLFTSPPSPHTSVTTAAKRKEEGKGVAMVEGEERKSASPAPSRPPVPLQSRSAPPLPPAPLCRISSRKSSDRDVADGRERERGQNPSKKMETIGGSDPGEAKTGSKPDLPGDAADQGNSLEDEVKKETEKGEGEKQEEEQDKSSSQGPPSVKKPTRPVPPPRRKPGDSPVCTNQPTAAANQTAGMRAPAPSAARRPDVSLYSPQGGAVMGTDPDSSSASSTEEEDVCQEHEQHTRPADSRSPKVTVRRTPTTVMLDRARHRLSTVLTGLISHDRRLTQRLVELARDPMSYFGNLVKEHRAFTLETMSNHSSSTELLQEIRQMVTQLKSYLLQSTEMQSMLEPQHQYAQDKLESIVEAALCKSVLKPLRDPIYQRLEKLHTEDGSLIQLAEKQSVVLGSTTTGLGITTAVPEASAMEKISIKLNKLHLEYSPQRKIELLLKASKIIYDSMSVSNPGRAHGADDFLPVMMYVLARSNLSNLQLDVEYMMELMDPSLALGEGSYYLTTTYGALEHIKSFDQQRSATRQLSREVQDSIHRWERRRTLNQERMTQASVRDFLTVCCPEVGSNPKTLGVLPTTTIQQLAEQCAARFDQDSYILSVDIDGVHRPLGPTELAVTVKNNCQRGTYCFVYHPLDQPNNQRHRSCPTDPPPAPPVQRLFPAEEAAVDVAELETEEESLISL